jgi:hypothetical protein
MQSYGGNRKLSSSLSTTRGLCQSGKKCMRKDGHEGEHWPTDGEDE